VAAGSEGCLLLTVFLVPDWSLRVTSQCQQIDCTAGMAGRYVMAFQLLTIFHLLQINGNSSRCDSQPKLAGGCTLVIGTVTGVPQVAVKRY